jgi:osmotically-inducible protein OsmY
VAESGQSRILDDVRAALAADARIARPPHDVRLAMDGGVLTLEGEVADIVAKKLALERAAAVPGVEGIIDRLRVVPGEPMSDYEILDRLSKVLASELAFQECTIAIGCPVQPCRTSVETVRVGRPEPSGTIEIAVDDGVVTLDGEVPSLAHKRLAGVLAWWIPGSRDVVNGLAVEPPEEDSDDEITEAVRLALEKDPFVEAYEIRVATRNAVVTLTGVAHSDLQRRMAELDAWYVFGVDAVDDHRAVRRSSALPRDEPHGSLLQ